MKKLLVLFVLAIPVVAAAAFVGRQIGFTDIQTAVFAVSMFVFVMSFPVWGKIADLLARYEQAINGVVKAIWGLLTILIVYSLGYMAGLDGKIETGLVMAIVIPGLMWGGLSLISFMKKVLNFLEKRNPKLIKAVATVLACTLVPFVVLVIFNPMVLNLTPLESGLLATAAGTAVGIICWKAF